MSKPRKKKSSGKKLTKYEKVLLTTATLNLIKAHVLTGLICFIKTILPSGISDLDLINRSPAYYRYVKENPKEQTLAMLLGSVFHKLVPEPETFTAEYAVCPAVDRRTKAGKEVYQAFVNSLNDLCRRKRYGFKRLFHQGCDQRGQCSRGNGCDAENG